MRNEEVSIDECNEFKNDEEDLENSYIKNEKKIYVYRALKALKEQLEEDGIEDLTNSFKRN